MEMLHSNYARRKPIFNDNKSICNDPGCHPAEVKFLGMGNKIYNIQGSKA
jgi:hypothetical protein